jgi:cell division protein FtsZ
LLSLESLIYFSFIIIDARARRELAMRGKIGLGVEPPEDLAGFGQVRIVAVGCGGAGCNAIHHMSAAGLEGTKTLAINTDLQQLERIAADARVLIGRRNTGGLGAGGDPAAGREAAERAEDILERYIRGADMVFLTAGLGGGTGTGSAPVVARLAKEEGALVVGMVSTPFHVEGSRILVAEAGLSALRDWTDTLIVLDNNRLLELAPHLPLQKAFALMNQMISEVVGSIAETLTQPSLINLDFADVKTIMGAGGPSAIFAGEKSLAEGSEKAVSSILQNPLLDADLHEAEGCLMHLTGGPDLTLRDATAMARAVAQELDPTANIIWGARIRPEMRGKAKLMAIVTGVKSAQVLGKAGKRKERLERAPGRLR